MRHASCMLSNTWKKKGWICASVMWKEHAGIVESSKIYLMVPTKAASSTMGYVVFFLQLPQIVEALEKWKNYLVNQDAELEEER